ncbi:MAG: YdeI/OmpD-associated family protein [Thermoanaerobaculia bacterium]
MSKKDPRVDGYIAKAAPFAQPVLEHLRTLIHRAEPEIGETIKWGMPFFELEGIVCHLAAFKAHCAFGFWKGGRPEPTGKEGEAMGQFGRITGLAGLPKDATIVKLVREAVKRNRSGEKAPAPAKKVRAAIEMTPGFRTALAKSRVARKAFDAFPPSHQREYLEWIADAKTEATRDKRIATSIEWLAEGKSRMWKYRK